MKRILSVFLLILLLLSVSAPILSAESDETIDVYAKYEESIDGIYRANLKNGSATVTAAGGATVSVSGAPASARALEVFPVPPFEDAALDWLGIKIRDHGILSHAYIINFVDEAGEKASADGVSVTVACPHCNGDETVIGLNADGTATPIDTAQGVFRANGSTYYVVAERIVRADVTVPIRGEDNEIHADATLIGKIAELHELDFEEIDHIVGDHVTTGVVEIDLSHIDEAVTVATLPMASVKHIVEAAEEVHNDTEALQVDFPSGSVKLDDKTLRAIIDQVGEETTVNLVLESVGMDRLNNDQKSALENMNVYGGVEAYLLCNTTSVRVSDFEGGTATIYAPFTLPKGVRASKISVWHVADDGSVEKMKTSYKNGVISWEVGHFSDFIIASEQERELPLKDSVPVGGWILIGSLSGLLIDAVAILILEKAMGRLKKR